MNKQRRVTGPRGVAQLVCRDKSGAVVIELKLSLDSYYDEGVDVIDSNQCRAANKIAAIEGMLYAPDGHVYQRCENHYDRRGKRIRGWIEFDDGTIVED